ncbi:PREDICTED: uncharacterized protein LOC105462867 [Wasmannia auropunctata]|uniref:uncharacterized protein LOC105462867 n=1 Tax=Wasmannia auropunctata TaxID=64793 RepID=UPI0005EEB048|nr:PREDICTED: uncharacterized protein LOC105462867 [Wasmannia auropunctata]XP_011708041.1 PREDICTED: uncharacterized protein LOC105462867 [Wasmannia auropunctata]
MMLNGIAIKSRISKKIFMRNVQTIQRLYNAALSRRLFGTNQPLLEYNKEFEKFKLKQAKMQCDDGRPTYLKAGARDKALFNFTVALLLFNTMISLYSYGKLFLSFYR